MRFKLGLAMSMVVLSTAALAPAAQASTLTIVNAVEEEAQEVHLHSTDIAFDTNWGQWDCSETALTAGITENNADPVTSQLTEGVINGCTSPIGTDVDITSVESPGSITLNADGTGQLPLRLAEVVGPVSCTVGGVLDLDWSSTPEKHFHGHLMGEGKGWFCENAQQEVEGTFSLLDEYGYLAQLVVTP